MRFISGEKLVNIIPLILTSAIALGNNKRTRNYFGGMGRKPDAITPDTWKLEIDR
jgi:hypothetical protein